MKVAQYARLVARESRRSRGRIALFMGCIAVGVAAIVLVAGLSTSVNDGVRAEGRRLMADEPTGNLDGENGRIVLDMMLSLRRDHGTTLVLVTHDAALAELSDRVIRLRDGRVVDTESHAAAEASVGAEAAR